MSNPPALNARRVAVLFGLGVLISLSVDLRAGGGDVTFGELRYVPADHSLAVSFRSTPDELELVLAAKFHRLTRLRSTPNIDTLILQYLRGKFHIAVAGKAVVLQWVGKDISTRWAWTYVDASLPQTGVDAVTLKTSAWLELGAAHRLAMDIIVAGHKRVVRFSRDSETTVIPLPGAAAEPTPSKAAAKTAAGAPNDG